MGNVIKVGIAQFQAAHLDIGRSLDILKTIVAKAAEEKHDLLVFGETWLSGYPVWLDHCPEIAQWDNAATKEAYLRLFKSSITVPGPVTDTISQLAKDNELAIVIGVNEKQESGPGNATLYNSLLTFDKQGILRNHHRKLMPTFTEKMIYGLGDAQGLQAVDLGFGRLGGLICWEHWMPLTRQAMHDSGESIHIAVWPTVAERHQIASRHYAFEGRCYVIAAGQLIRAKDIPDCLTLPDYLKDNPEAWVCEGGSCIINPRGEYVVAPVFHKEALISTSIDLDDCIKEQMTLDVSGHYQRPDIFDLTINRKRK